LGKQGKDVEYLDVLESSNNMNAMLKHSEGVRKVPVIVAGDDVTIGSEGQT
jgi:glutaredoxin